MNFAIIYVSTFFIGTFLDQNILSTSCSSTLTYEPINPLVDEMNTKKFLIFHKRITS